MTQKCYNTMLHNTMVRMHNMRNTMLIMNNIVSDLKKCGSVQARVSGLEETWHFKWLRILRRSPLLLHRATLDTGGAVLNSDYEYILLHFPIGGFAILTFIPELPGIHRRAQTNRQLLLMNCKRWWSCWRNSLLHIRMLTFRGRVPTHMPCLSSGTNFRKCTRTASNIFFLALETALL